MENKNKVHYIAVTGILKKDGKYLICKRSPNEKAFPEKWCVPGGKVEVKDFINQSKDTTHHWFDIFEKTLRKEIRELEIILSSSISSAFIKLSLLQSIYNNIIQ